MSEAGRRLRVVALGLVCLAAVAFWPAGPAPIEPDEAAVVRAFYAQPVEDVGVHLLGRGETLDGLLSRAAIGVADRARLLLALREHANPRRLRPGVEVTVRRWAEDRSIRMVEVRLDPDRMVRLEPDEIGWTSKLVETPVVVDTIYMAGTIEAGRSLYDALVGSNALELPVEERVKVAWELAEIFAYKLDFAHDIRPGDAFRVAFEREARPDGSTRWRRILAAEISNRGESFPALYFRVGEHDDGYYDYDGRSVRLALRRYPIDFPRITSSFSWRRYHPILGRYRAHLGTDFGAAHGTPVRATGDGTVVMAGRDGGYGNVVVIRHPGGYTSRYAHLSSFADGIAPGRPVREGQRIGSVGATGLATGPHLHYELRKNGQPLNAARVRLPGAPPVPERLRSEFARTVQERLQLLERASAVGTAMAGSPEQTTGG